MLFLSESKPAAHPCPWVRVTSPFQMHVPIWPFRIENTFGRAPRFQLYNQPVVIPTLYPKSKVNTGKSIRTEKTETQSPVKVSKNQLFSACPVICQIFLQSWQSLQICFHPNFPTVCHPHKYSGKNPAATNLPPHKQQRTCNCCHSAVQHLPQLYTGSNCYSLTSRTENASYCRVLTLRAELPQI